MSSSITTAVPSGLVSDWCIQDSVDVQGNANVCGDSGKHPSDYGTICCAGDIVDTASDTYRYGNANDTINLDTLVCCRIEGPQANGGLQAIATDRNQCTEGNATPLASFAATNTANAALWEKTLTSAYQSIGPSTTVIGDYVPLQSPRCLWVYTKTGVALRNVTVPAADITTPPAPTTDAMGPAITTRSSMLNTTVDSVTSVSSSMADATTSVSEPSAASTSAVSSITDATTSPTPASGAAPVAGLNSTVYLLLLAFIFFGVART
jgi:hypothetical protein